MPRRSRPPCLNWRPFSIASSTRSPRVAARRCRRAGRTEAAAGPANSCHFRAAPERCLPGPSIGQRGCGALSCAPRSRIRTAMQRNTQVSLIGAPTDIGAGHRGASMGPEALRVAGIGQALTQRGIKVVDRGNLSWSDESVDRPDRWLSASGRSGGLESFGHGGRRGRTRPGPSAGAARWRPLSGHRFDHRRRPALPRRATSGC